MSSVASASGTANDATVQVAYDPDRAITDLKRRLRAVRELCERAAAAGQLLNPSDVLAELDRKE